MDNDYIVVMSEKDRNKYLMLLLQDLVKAKNTNAILLLKSLINNDTESTKKSFQIIAEPYLNDIRNGN